MPARDNTTEHVSRFVVFAESLFMKRCGAIAGQQIDGRKTRALRPNKFDIQKCNGLSQMTGIHIDIAPNIVLVVV